MGKQREKRFFTAAESAEIWDRWQRGEGLKLIGRVFGETSSSIFAHLRQHGGIRPAARRRFRRVLSWLGATRFRGAWRRERRWLDRQPAGSCGVERRSRYVLLAKVANRDSRSVVNAL